MRETERRSGVGALDTLSTGELLAVMNGADAEVAGAVGRELPRIGSAVDAVVAALEGGGRLVYVGAGSSGRLGVLDASECPPTFGVEAGLIRGILAGGSEALADAAEGAEDDGAAGAEDVRRAGVSAGDAVVGIAASGRTPYTLGAVRAARELGAVTVGVSNSEGSELGRSVEYPIEVATGPEVLAGSTRLKAGTAQKMVLNMISTATMVRLGYVYENLMVGVRASNEKLRQRATMIVSEVSARPAAEAREALERTGYGVREAVLLLDGVESPEEARRRLAKSGGSLRRARKTAGA